MTEKREKSSHYFRKLSSSCSRWRGKRKKKTVGKMQECIQAMELRENKTVVIYGKTQQLLKNKKFFNHNVLIIMVNLPVLLKSKLTLEEKKTLETV